MIEPSFLDELEQFDTAQKRHVASIFQGEEITREVGEGLTFSDYRRYVPGDDTRLIDWKLYGRTGGYYVKQFERERNLTVHVLVDTSGSMDYGEDDAHKFETAAKLGLGFAYLTATENNDFRFSTYSETFDRIDAGRSSEGEVLQLVDRCNEVDLDEAVDFDRALGEYASTIGSRSLVLVASDFLADPAAILDGLAPLARNRLVLAHVVAPTERDLPVRGDVIFEDLEGDSSLRTYFSNRLDGHYRERLDTHLSRVGELASDLGARHELVDTGADFFDSFADVWVE